MDGRGGQSSVIGSGFGGKRLTTMGTGRDANVGQGTGIRMTKKTSARTGDEVWEPSLGCLPDDES